MTRVVFSKTLAARLLSYSSLALLLVGSVACKAKPSEKACEEAINNVNKILGQGSNDMGADPIAVIRSCRGNSSIESVECMRVAKTTEDIKLCEGDIGDKYFQEEVKANQDLLDKAGAKAEEAPKTETP